MSFPTPADLNDLQGDVVLGIPKRAQDFIFFGINDAPAFKKGLAQLIPLISTTAQVQQMRKDIDAHKTACHPGLIQLVGTNIGFTKQGLTKLGATDGLGDGPFDAGMLAHAQQLGDNGTAGENGFDPAWTPAFKAPIDGILSVAGDCRLRVEEGVNKALHVLGNSVKQVLKVPADVRPGKEKGHEHFGFMDGISVPGIKALTGLLPGQIEVQPGVLICGQNGDTVQRPAWAKNGSFLCYRQLSQLVPEFDKFLVDNPVDVPGLPRDQGSELMGARMVGRWKSGAPIDITPTKDDPVLANDPQKNNDFNFSDAAQDQTRCPFAAHVRKTNPRADLSGTSLTDHMIMRQGIPFGPEVTEQERATHKTQLDRGLSFVCYQSNLSKGFEFVQESWANNPGFIFGKPVQPGFDPIIGQKNGEARTATGMQTGNQSGSTSFPFEFVVSKGGCYFFVPSLTALKSKLAV